MNWYYLWGTSVAWVLLSLEIGAMYNPNEIQDLSSLSTNMNLNILQYNANLLSASRFLSLILEKFPQVPSSPTERLQVDAWGSFFSVVGKELLRGLGNRLFCVACYAGVSVLKLLAPIHGIEELISPVIVEICIRFFNTPQDVCEGYVNMDSEFILYPLRNTPYNVSTICANLVGFGCLGQDDDFWTIQFPDTPKPPLNTAKPPKDGSPTLTVLHLTDLHLDRFYLEGSPSDCGLELCCREDSPPSKSAVTGGPWGAYRVCEVPVRTMISLLDHLNSTLKPDLVIFTGDIPPHDTWISNRKEHLYLLDYFADMLKKYFPYSVFLAVGNHEGVPMDAFPPQSITGIKSNDWLYEKLWSTWSKWLPESTYATIRKGGFYSTPARKGLRIISVNAMFAKSTNMWLYVNLTDPMDQLQWLVDELQKAEDIGEKVLLITHISLGDESQFTVWTRNFYVIVNRYENTIIGTLCGHTHFDQFEVLYDDSEDKRPTRVTYISPSISPLDNLNLAYRTFILDGDYDGSSFEILDHTTYYADLAEGNKNNKTLQWKKLYSAKEFYGLDSLQASEWDKLITRMKHNPELFDKFYRMFSSANLLYPSCDEHCKDTLLCGLKRGRSRDFNMCNV